ncbi:hypothetical protein J5J86_00030 [Aquabacter sp. L1I39]|uniref:hypothetical protein n=1 Tax=Aquabacter sp. L1I39 TaxID=2820278 RepID=UPI001ADAA581|nr:hypothetical protein [Aquabacter sp. L1I39]QTL03813.1 hypothetical protein J5J86_00030 [Aquabacter sp. L1I39]
MKPEPKPLREDIFVSLCFPEPLASEDDVSVVLKASRQISARFRYFEVLIIARVGDADDLLSACLSGSPHVRVIKVRGTRRHYANRVVAANEAIGDVVVITSLAEAGALDLPGMVAAASDQNAVTVFTREQRSWTNRLLQALGSASRFMISSGDMRTIAIPRVWMSRLLAHPQYNLALRFPPLGQGLPILHIPAPFTRISASSDATFWRRVALAYQLSVNAAPVALIGVGLLSCVVVLGALAYAIFAVGVVIFASHVQPGWFTTSIIQAGTAGYLALAILGLSMGLQKILEHLEPQVADTVVEEICNTDLPAQIHDLNVSVEMGHAPEVPHDRGPAGGSAP